MMPKNTFENLREDKKLRIFESAVNEFSLNTFTDASINQIIKEAKISRGSFYQYFEDKEDLFRYVITRIREEKIEILYDVDEEQSGEFIHVFIQSMEYMLKWKSIKPKYFQIGMLMEKDESDIVRELKGLTSFGINRLKAMIKEDQKNGHIRIDIDVDLVLDMVLTSGMKLVKQCDNNDEFDSNKFSDQMNKLIDVVQNGIHTRR